MSAGSRFRAGSWLLSGVLLVGLPLHADVFKPAYLQLEQTGAETYEVLWKVPALDADTTLRVKPVFPAGTVEPDQRSRIFAGGASVQRWQIRVPGGLEGRAIAFSGLQDATLDVLVRVSRLDGSEQLERVLPIEPAFTLRPSPGPGEVVTTYLVLGVEHILAGVDHLLFVLSLMMIVTGMRRLLLTITAFTLAHSMTLALATLDIIRVPGPPVEAIIALSIVFVAAEILHVRQGRQSLAARKPWLVAFGFGLLHGLGFAGALAEVGLPQNAIPLALLFFNLGVELGQLLFIAAVFALATLAVRLLRGQPDPRWTLVAPAYLIGGIASVWVVERTLAFWS
ncbi:MAG: HupE/UreJ family protein [Gammaproteobacteria bacterium]